MPYIENKGANLYWEEAGSGPPMLMIMGLSFTLEMWFRLVPQLIDSYRVITFDNRGVGRSSIPRGPYSIPTMADDAMAVLDAAGEQDAHIIGASMGGMIAQEVALRYPHRVRTLALGCTSYSGMFGRWPHFKHGPGIAWFQAEDRIGRERHLRNLLYAAGTPDHLIEEDIQIRCANPWVFKGVVSQLIGILLWSSYSRLPNITAPTLVIHGDEDHLLPPENGQIIATRIPNARFDLIRGAGHVLTTDQPELTVQSLLRFLKQHAPETSDSRLPLSTRSGPVQDSAS